MNMWMSKLMISCKHATALIELRTERKLLFSEKAKLLLHNRICETCKTYAIQSIMLSKLLDKYIDIPIEQLMIMENADLKEKIISKL